MRNIVRNRQFCLFILFASFSLASCEKSYGIEVSFGPVTNISFSAGFPDNVYKEQSLLFEEMHSRHVVNDLKEYKGVWTICFQHGRDVRFSESVFPVVRVNESGRWSISGIETEIAAYRDGAGNLALPILSIEDDGYWCLNGLHTGFPAEEYRSFLVEEGNDTLNVKGFLIDEDRLHIYLSDDSIRPYDIIKEGFYLVPEYWMEHLVEKEILAESAIREADGDCTTFVFFTDTHWGKNMKKSPSLIRHIYGFTPIDDVIFGGDVITTHSSNLVAPMELGKDFQASFAFLGTRFHCLYGNHDNNSDSQASKTEYHLSDEQVYSWLQSQMTDVVYDDHFNFYYDNPLTKTRIICLDTGRYYYQQFRDKLPDTVSYAIETLSTLPEGWHVIMASHIWCTAKKQSDGTYKQYIESYITPILKVFDDYNARQSGAYTFNKQSVTYDFSKSSGQIEFCIGGHTHGSFTTASEGGIPIIITNSDYFSNPEKGTVREQSITLVIADYKNRKLHLYVVGRGVDRILDL